MKQLPSLTKFGITLLIAAGTSLGSLTASADTGTTWFGEPAIGQWMAGIKIGNTEVDIPGYDKGSNAALMLGYQFARPIGAGGQSSIEFELGQSSDADIDFSSDRGIRGDWNSDTLAAYFAYRSAGTIYFKGKLGALHSSINSDFNLVRADAKSTETNFAYGLGLGYQIPGSETVQIEAEWVNSSGDHDLNMLTLGINFLF